MKPKSPTLTLALTLDGAVLLLEELWDQLQATASIATGAESRSDAFQLVASRLTSCQFRLRESIRSMQSDLVTPSATVRLMLATLGEVSELLELSSSNERADHVALLYRAQDAVLASLHELRAQLVRLDYPGPNAPHRSASVEAH